MPAGDAFNKDGQWVLNKLAPVIGSSRCTSARGTIGLTTQLLASTTARKVTLLQTTLQASIQGGLHGPWGPESSKGGDWGKGSAERLLGLQDTARHPRLGPEGIWGSWAGSGAGWVCLPRVPGSSPHVFRLLPGPSGLRAWPEAPSRLAAQPHTQTIPGQTHQRLWVGGCP